LRLFGVLAFEWKGHLCWTTVQVLNNEFEYLGGAMTSERTVNTAQVCCGVTPGMAVPV
jgi:hypothetical protein